MSRKEISHTLPTGYILNKKYVIDYVRGEGGFGITYVGHIYDSNPVQNVAIKEYFPSGVASRDHSDTPYMVTHFSGDFSVSFRKGLHRFLNEAVLLKNFAYLDSIVSILDVFEALTAKDRPYKKPMPLRKALLVLDNMASCGQIDPDILALFKKSRAWRGVL